MRFLRAIPIVCGKAPLKGVTMKSMTGYGKAEYSENGVTLTVEIKTVNNRFLDLTPKYPRAFMPLEDVIRKSVQSKISRGKADLFVTFKDTRKGAEEVEVDLNLAKAYVEAAKKISFEFSELENDFTVCSLMRTQDVLKAAESAFNVEEISPILSKVTLSACDNLNAMREFEGAKLKKDLLTRLETVKNLVDEIKKLAPLVSENYRVKMSGRLKEVLGGTEIDEARILQETAVFADKCNIDEEITRLYSHIDQFKSIAGSEGEIGKKLDFLVQEFNREANTVCSKSNDVGVTDAALKLKCEIEKIREQIQNVE